MAQQTSSFQTSAIERRTRGETKAETAVKGETSFKNMPNTRVNQVRSHI